MKEQISCFDIDGTLARGMLFVPLAKSEHAAGLIKDDSYNQINAVLAAYKSGKLEYEDAAEKLLQAHAQGLAGKEHQKLKDHAKDFLALNEKELFYNFGRRVIKLLSRKHKFFVVTAEPQYLAEATADFFGLDGYMSSVYAEQNGIFTGEIELSLTHRSAKSAALSQYAIEYAFGDSEGDIEMLGNAANAYCISPTPGLAAIAREKGWNIFDGDDEESILKTLPN